MPKYELMYIIGNVESDNEIPGVIEEVKKDLSETEATIHKHEELGKKRLAYPIKKTRNAHYVLVQFEAESNQVKGFEAKLRANQQVLRHLVLNIDEALKRIEKDRVVHSKMKPRREPEADRPSGSKPRPKARPSTTGKKIEIDLDAEIEKALESEDLK